jgi:hypothetical protein
MKRLFCLFACLSGFSVQASIKNLVVAQNLGNRRFIPHVESETIDGRTSFYSVSGENFSSPFKNRPCPISPVTEVTPVKNNDLYDDCVVKDTPPPSPEKK